MIHEHRLDEELAVIDVEHPEQQITSILCQIASCQYDQTVVEEEADRRSLESISLDLAAKNVQTRPELGGLPLEDVHKVRPEAA
jgi:hypothetical protein